MKTLKKTLCLVLAMVMVFGLCAVSASAKLEYTDNDDINYEEAVDVLSGIGILQGDERGFRPGDPITRAEAAKIIAYIKIGNATQADALKASTDPFTDVPATHWAAGYISYCASLGIIGGMGDGTYHPSEPVSGLAFAKMLLCALGYGQREEYTGSDWSIKTATDGIRLGVFDDYIAGANLDPATREQCALYAFNVIARNRTGSTTAASNDLGLLKVTYSQLAGDYVANGAFGNNVSVDANKQSTFAGDYNLAVDEADDNDFGHPTGYHYTQKIGNATKTITADYTDDSRLKEVYTTKVTGDDIYKLLGKDTIKNSAIKIYIDGKDETTTMEALNDNREWNVTNLAKGKTDQLYGTGNGVETYVYAWEDDTDGDQICIVCVNTYLVKVDKVNKATSTKERSVQINLLGNTIAGITTSTTYETDEFEKGDYVLVTATVTGATNGAKIQSMEPAEVVEGEITRFNQNGTKLSIVVNGTTYESAEKVTIQDWTDGNELSNALVDGKDYKVYVNKGYVIAVDAVTADTSYVYVAQMGVKADDSGKIGTGYVVKADIYYADGTNEVVTVNTTADANGVTNAFKGSGVDGVDFTNIIASTNITKDQFIGVYQMTWKDDKAVLGNAATDIAGNKLVNKGVEYIDGTNTFDSKTVFFYVSGKYAPGDGEDSLTVTAYTGINNVPVAKTGDTALKKGIIDDTKIKAALVEPSFSGAGDTVYFYTGTTSGEYSRVGTTDIIYFVYAAGADDKTEIRQTYKSSEIESALTAGANKGFYKVGNDGKLATVSGENGDLYYVNTATSGFTVNGNTLTVSEVGYALYDCHIVDVTDSADPITDKADLTGATIFFAYDKDTKAVTDLYVTAHAAP